MNRAYHRVSVIESFNQKLNQTETCIDRQAGLKTRLYNVVEADLKVRLGTPVARAIRHERTPDSLQRFRVVRGEILPRGLRHQSHGGRQCCGVQSALPERS
jgi:hypothetical protein